MSDNPFSEPDDDRTVIRPAPRGRHPASPPRAAAPASAPPLARGTTSASIPVFDHASPAISVSPLSIAASPVLELLNHLRQLRQTTDVAALRQRCLQDLRAFERRAHDAGITMETLRPAHYALCAAIDDVVLNSPWGATSDWSKQTLVANQHPGVRDPDYFFVLLKQMLAAPQRFLAAIEVMYFCLSFGFMGRYRRERREGELGDVRAATHAAIAARHQAATPELSRRWRGVTVPYQRDRYGVPVWVALAGAAAVCGGLVLWTSSSLNAASDVLQEQALAAPPMQMPQITRAAVVQPLPPPPPTPEQTALDRLQTALQQDIDRQAVILLGTPATPIIRLADRAMFASGSASVAAASVPMLERVAAALRNERGVLQVIGYTDNQPFHTVRFPSNVQLSAARAEAVRAVLARAIGDPAKISAEGRGEADPIAPNTSAEGREQNRRIEIVLQQPRD
jgi:type VI secretion system protein ImpK